MLRSRPQAALWLAISFVTAATALHSQDDKTRGRKYNPPPPVAHIVVSVSKATNGKPVESAAVIFHTVHNGKDQGNLEVKTNEEGQAIIDVIPIGDLVRLQVIKSGFQTYGEDYSIEGATKEIAVKLKPPTRQYSTYENHPENSQQPADGATPASAPH